MRREHFQKPFISRDADGRWVYELSLDACDDRPGFEVRAVRHLFGLNGLGHDVEELLCDYFASIDDAQRDYNIRKQELAGNGYTESPLDVQIRPFNITR